MYSGVDLFMSYPSGNSRSIYDDIMVNDPTRYSYQVNSCAKFPDSHILSGGILVEFVRFFLSIEKNNSNTGQKSAPLFWIELTVKSNRLNFGFALCKVKVNLLEYSKNIPPPSSSELHQS